MLVGVSPSPGTLVSGANRRRSILEVGVMRDKLEYIFLSFQSVSCRKKNRLSLCFLTLLCVAIETGVLGSGEQCHL